MGSPREGSNRAHLLPTQGEGGVGHILTNTKCLARFPSRITSSQGEPNLFILLSMAEDVGSPCEGISRVLADVWVTIVNLLCSRSVFCAVE